LFGTSVAWGFRESLALDEIGSLEGTSGNLISKNEAKFPHLSIAHEPNESLQKDTCRP
jgi:hypothetical protein